MLALTACVGLFMRIIEAKDFMVLASMAFGFYFAVKPSDNQGGGDFAGGVK